MTMHVDERSGVIVSPDEIIERARGIEKEITVLDGDILAASESLKELKATREKLVNNLRAIVRPVPLFDAAAVAAAAAERPYGDTRMTLTDMKGNETDVTDAMNALAKKRKH